MRPPIIRPRRQVFAGTGTGVSVTAGGSANVKGSYATLGTLDFETALVVVSIVAISSTRSVRVDIAANSGGADTIVAEDLFCDGLSSAFPTLAIFELPLRLPAGATLKARAAQSSAGANVLVHVETFSLSSGYAPGFSKGLKNLCGIGSNCQPTATVTTTGQTPTAWTELVTSTALDLIDLWAQPAGAADATRTATAFLVEIAIGASGSEVVVGQVGYFSMSAGFPNAPRRLRTGRIPAGTRVSYRVQASATASADLIGLNLWGMAA